MIIKIKLLFLKRSKNILNIKIDNIDKKSCHDIQLGDILLDKIGSNFLQFLLLFFTFS